MSSKEASPAETDSDGPDREYQWRSLSLSELEAVYRQDITSEMRRQGMDPDKRYPTYKWLAENGFRGFEDSLRTQHGMTVREFFSDRLNYSHPSEAKTNTYDWGFDHARTQEEIERFLDSLRDRKGRKEGTLASKRSRLAKYARTYEQLHGTSDLLDPASGEDLDKYATEQTISYGRAVETFDKICSQLSTNRSKKMYYADVKQFYDRLERWGYIDFNPVEEVPEDFDWDTSEDPDNQSLTAEDVRLLFSEADGVSERLLVVALAGWGLRPNEVASLHCFQFRNFFDSDGSYPSDDDAWPFVEFGDGRKNGPGTVTMLYGTDVLSDRLESVSNADWNGYLYPSNLSKSGHVSTQTIRNRFKRLADRAGVSVDGEVPTPKMGRRFWYTSYQTVMSEVYERLDEIAEEQGSSDANVVAKNYLSEDARRRMRRELMEEALAEAFEGL